MMDKDGSVLFNDALNTFATLRNTPITNRMVFFAIPCILYKNVFVAITLGLGCIQTFKRYTIKYYIFFSHSSSCMIKPSFEYFL